MALRSAFNPRTILLALSVCFSATIASDMLLLTPRKVERLALGQSVLMRTAAYDTLIAAYDTKAAFASFLPTVGLSASATHLDEAPTFSIEGAPIEFQAGPQDLYKAGVAITQPIFTGGKILHAHKLAKHAARAQKLTYERKCAIAKLMALQRFWAYMGARQGLAVAQESRDWFVGLIEQQRLMLENGLIIELDLLKSETGLAQAKLRVLHAQNALRKTGEALLVFLNLPVETGIDVETGEAFAKTAVHAYPESGALDAMIAQREDIEAMEAQLSVIRATKRIQMAAYAPNLSGIFNYAFTNERAEDFETMEGAWSATAALQWPIFDWGKSWREMQKTAARINQLQIQLENRRKEVKTEILENYRSLEEALAGLAIAEDAVAIARRALEIAELRYNEGMITDISLRETRKSLTEAQAQLIQSHIQTEITAVAYSVSAGLDSGE